MTVTYKTEKEIREWLYMMRDAAGREAKEASFRNDKLNREWYSGYGDAFNDCLRFLNGDFDTGASKK